MVPDPNYDQIHAEILAYLKERWGKRPPTPRQRGFIARYRLEWEGELSKFSAWVAIDEYCRTHPRRPGI